MHNALSIICYQISIVGESDWSREGERGRKKINLNFGLDVTKSSRRYLSGPTCSAIFTNYWLANPLVYIFELTICFETRFNMAHDLKMARYTEQSKLS